MRVLALALACVAIFAAFACVSANPARRQRLAVGVGGGSITSTEDEDVWVGTGVSLHAGYGYTLTPPGSKVQVAAECNIVRQGVARMMTSAGAGIELQTTMMLMPGVRFASPSRYPVVFAGSVGAAVVRTAVRVASPVSGFASNGTTSLVPGFTFGFGGGFTPRVTWWFGMRGVRGATYRAPNAVTIPFHTGAGAFEVAVLF